MTKGNKRGKTENYWHRHTFSACIHYNTDNTKCYLLTAAGGGGDDDVGDDDDDDDAGNATERRRQWLYITSTLSDAAAR